MRFLKNEDSWSLDALTPAEWQLIEELPGIAAGEGFRPASRERLFPSPFDTSTLADEDTLSHVDDWEEFVKPDLESTFSQSRDIVKEDLSGVRNLSPEEMPEIDAFEWLGENLELKRVDVPVEHTEPWYSVLNQARLLMNEEYGLADAEDRAIAQSEGIHSIDQDRVLLLAQYELYSVLQSILIESIMDL
ncbi:MAG: hypothetical protein CMO55_13595 [Verrucomicrobiales bacterium]|nr:hypothetical protein [Verrucomicrobiales bacterium]